MLGIALGAERLFILTDVDALYRKFGTSEATPIKSISVPQLKMLIDEHELPAGSMGSKLSAVVSFLEGISTEHTN